MNSLVPCACDAWPYNKYKEQINCYTVNPGHWKIPVTQVGFEPTTFGLHAHCSTIWATELRWGQRVSESHLILHVCKSFLQQTCKGQINADEQCFDFSLESTSVISNKWSDTHTLTSSTRTALKNSSGSGKFQTHDLWVTYPLLYHLSCRATMGTAWVNPIWYYMCTEISCNKHVEHVLLTSY